MSPSAIWIKSLSLSATQWAAVSTWDPLISVPPHKILKTPASSGYHKEAIHGHRPGEASSPEQWGVTKKFFYCFFSNGTSMNSNSLTVNSFSTCQWDFSFFLVWTHSWSVQVTPRSSCNNILLFTTDHWNPEDKATVPFSDEAPHLSNDFILGWSQVMIQWSLLLCFCWGLPCLHSQFQSNEVEHRSSHPGCIFSLHDHQCQHLCSCYHKLWFSMVLATLVYILQSHKR